MFHVKHSFEICRLMSDRQEKPKSDLPMVNAVGAKGVYFKSSELNIATTKRTHPRGKLFALLADLKTALIFIFVASFVLWVRRNIAL